MSGDTGAAIVKLFKLHDTNGDGIVTKEQLRFIMAGIGIPMNVYESILQQLAGACVDDVRYEEFVAYLFRPQAGDAASTAAPTEVGEGSWPMTPSIDGSEVSQLQEQRPQMLSMIAECMPELLVTIGSYVAESACDVANFFNVDRSVYARDAQEIWQIAYCDRWPAFYDSLLHQGMNEWHTQYRKTWEGVLECTLEVFDREKKLGFTMAAMPAKVRYCRGTGHHARYHARYLSASKGVQEIIPVKEEHRLRFCPESARHQLCPHTSQLQYTPAGSTQTAGTASAAEYPYRVLEGISGLEEGQDVEVQWKMQKESPFGWWFGHLESLHNEPNGLRASATITFRHFPETSRWYRMNIRIGGPEEHQNELGGYTGGLRPVSNEEAGRWKVFFPKELIFH